jgi:integrase
LAFLKHLFTMAITWGKVAENPVKRVKRIHEPHGHTRCLTPAEEDRLLDACNPHLKPVVIAALHTGCRQSELLSLRWADVDIPRRLVTVHAAYAKDREPRSITMDAILLQTLEALPRRMISRPWCLAIATSNNRSGERRIERGYKASAFMISAIPLQVVWRNVTRQQRERGTFVIAYRQWRATKPARQRGGMV